MLPLFATLLWFQSPMPFEGAVFPIGGAPTDHLTLVDLNIDGNADIICWNTTFSVKLGATGSIFAPSTANYGSSNAQGGVVVGDVTGDGLPDAITARADTLNNKFYIQTFPSTGGGSLGAPIESFISNYSGTTNLQIWAVGDFDNDGKLDAIGIRNKSLFPNPGNVTDLVAMKGTGGGFFILAGTMSIAYPGTPAMLRDMDNDGKLDVVARGAGSLQIFKGTGAGAFAAPTTLTLSNTPTRFQFVDVTGDGIADIASLDTTNNSLYYSRGLAGGGFAAAALVGFVTTPDDFVATDVTGDGRLDLAVASRATGIVTIYKQSPVGTFTTPVTFAAGSPDAIVSSDFDHDGRMDLVVSLPGADAIVYFRNLGNSIFTFGPVAATGPTPYSGASGDIDGNGHVDVAVACSGDGTFETLLGDGSGALNASGSFTMGFNPLSIKLADLNGDGKLDAIVPVSLFNVGTYNGVTIRFGDGAGGFGAAQQLATTGHQPNDVAAGDLNGDGTPDLAISNTAGDVTVILGIAGAGPAGSPPNYYNAGTNSARINIASVTGDAFPDVLLAHSTVGAVLLAGNGAGGLGAPVSIQLGAASQAGAYAIAIADANLDGLPDLLGCSNSLKIAIGLAGGGFGASVTKTIGGGGTATSMAVGDATGDGFMDSVMGQPGGGSADMLGLMPGDGAGNFGPYAGFISDKGPSAVLPADTNEDGRLDLVAVYYSSSRVTVHKNMIGTPSAISSYGTGTHGCSGFMTHNATMNAIVGNPNFTITGLHAPPNSLGAFVIVDAQDAAGSTPFGFPLITHLDFAAATQLFIFDVVSDAGGSSFVPAPVPNLPTLAGQSFYGQSYWVEDITNGRACSPSTFEILSSLGLKITIQP
ncbi:MAG: VCBS repeat-containing protein [Planctomycetes bacterium]|nr:VCBS repeat-containing protein [Planctomycetota bacterium]